MRILAKLVLPLACVLLLAGSEPARADSAGTPGKIVGLLHNDDDSDNVGTYTGQLFVDVGGGTIEEYYWGGVICSGRDLDVDQERMLVDAMNGKKKVLPYYQVGQAAVHCLVSYGFAASTKAIPVVAK